jgi:RNA 3'-phosphate cyclase
MIEIDGSQSHGGGSILRLATGFSVLTQTPIKITNIRASRPKPGIQEQHIAGLRALNSLCEGKMLGDEIGSTELEFTPRPIGKSIADINIATAGSIGLVMQPILIACSNLNHPIKLRISGGGTVGKWAPPVSFLENVTFKHLEKMGFKIYLEVLRHGFYPKGGASVNIEIIPPGGILPLKIPELGNVFSVDGLSIDSNALRDGRVAERQKMSCQQALEKYFEGSAIVRDIGIEHADTDSPGSCLTCWIETDKTVLGTDMVGERGLRADIIGRTVADELLRLYESKATLDEMAADQILPFMLIAGNSIARIPRFTAHIETSIWLSEKFLGKRFTLEEENGVMVRT